MSESRSTSSLSIVTALMTGPSQLPLVEQKSKGPAAQARAALARKKALEADELKSPFAKLPSLKPLFSVEAKKHTLKTSRQIAGEIKETYALFGLKNTKKEHIDHIASLLTNRNMSEAFYFNVTKFLAHVIPDGGTITESDLGWEQEQFLPCHIRTTLEILLNLDKHITDGLDKQKAEDYLIKKLCNALETLQVVRLLNDACSVRGKEEFLLARNELGMLLAKIIFTLPSHQKFIFPVGWHEHYFYLICQTGTIRIVNGGIGSEEHEEKKGSTNEIHPKTILLYSQSDPESLEKLAHYFSDLIFARTLGERDALFWIYRLHDKPISEEEQKKDRNLAYPIHFDGNCVVYNFNIIDRFTEDQKLALWFAETERELLFEYRINDTPTTSTSLDEFVRVYGTIHLPSSLLESCILLHPRIKMLDRILMHSQTSSADENLLSNKDEFMHEALINYLELGISPTDATEASLMMQTNYNIIVQMASLDLHYCNLTDYDIPVLIELLPHFKNLKDLNLSSNKLSPKGVSLVRNYLENSASSLNQINLVDNTIDDFSTPIRKMSGPGR